MSGARCLRSKEIVSAMRLSVNHDDPSVHSTKMSYPFVMRIWWVVVVDFSMLTPCESRTLVEPDMASMP